MNEVHDFLPKDRGKSKDSVTQGMAVQQRISADGNEEFAGQLTLKTRDFSKSQAPGHSTNGARVLDAPISTELRNSTLFPDSASAQDEGVFQVNAGTSQTTSNLLSEKNLMEATRSALNALSINTGQSNNQAGGQFSQESNLTKTNSGQMTNEAAMEMLDMAQDNWTEMLLQRGQKRI